ncbi:MAG: hypothetical protein WC806_03620 [Candidatus Gracilibacteria bacterium]|jgi:hypothetical protein
MALKFGTRYLSWERMPDGSAIGRCKDEKIRFHAIPESDRVPYCCTLLGEDGLVEEHKSLRKAKDKADDYARRAGLPFFPQPKTDYGFVNARNARRDAMNKEMRSLRESAHAMEAAMRVAAKPV